MLAAYARYVSLVLLFLLMLDKCRALSELGKNENLLMDLCNALVIDLSRKGETVWIYRKIYSQYVSFAIGERIYLIRARYAAMLRAYLRNLINRRRYEVSQLVRNALLLQKRTQGIYILNDELLDFDRKISTEDNPYNVSRFVEPNCQVNGPPCNMYPIRLGYRRTLGATDEALKLIDARRKFIKQTYHPKRKIPPIDIDAELNRSLNLKYSTLSRPQTPDIKTSNTDFVNLAPDVMD